MEKIMELHIGRIIAQLRKEKGMTQEQLAEKLGISAPAVSKWETGTSYPDIMLLCPLARVLGTDVDALLEYEKNLPKEKVQEYAGHIIKTKQEQGVYAADERLQELLLQYPGSIDLKFYAVALLTTFAVQDTGGTDADKQRWNRQKRKLLEEIYESKNMDYLPSAISALATLELQDNRFDEAEKLLDELPEPIADASVLRIQLHLKKGEIEKAEEILQKRLFTLLVQANAYLSLMIERTQPDRHKVLELCGIYQKLDEIIYGGQGESDIVMAAVYGGMGEEQSAAHYLKAYLEKHMEQWPELNPILFAPSVRKTASTDAIALKERKEMMLRTIKADESMAKLCARKEIRDILESF